MLASFWNNIIYEPLYNALIFILGIVPGADVGVAVVVLTVMVKFALFPTARKVSRTQFVIKKIQPELDKLKKKYSKKEQRQELAFKTLELYKKHNINPLSGLVIILVQIPVVLGLYWVFYKGGLPDINSDILYSFVNGDISPDMMFLGLINMSEKSLVLATLAGITQFIHMTIIMPNIHKAEGTPTLKDDFMRSMQIQMKYFMPILVIIVAYIISSAVALYWVTNNIFTIGQELWIRRSLKERG